MNRIDEGTISFVVWHMADVPDLPDINETVLIADYVWAMGFGRYSGYGEWVIDYQKSYISHISYWARFPTVEIVHEQL